MSRAANKKDDLLYLLSVVFFVLFCFFSQLSVHDESAVITSLQWLYAFNSLKSR